MSDSSRAGSVKSQARSGQAVSGKCRFDMAQNGRVNTIGLTLSVLSTISGSEHNLVGNFYAKGHKIV